MYQKIKHKIKKHLRGRIGKYLLSIKDATYAITGVKEPKEKKNTKIRPFSRYIQSYTIEHLSKNKVSVISSSIFHQVKITMHAHAQKKGFILSFDPLEVSMLSHDLSCSSIKLPYIDASTTIKDNNTILIKNCEIKGEFPPIKTSQNITMVDQTLQSNWTHGGRFTTIIDFIIKPK